MRRINKIPSTVLATMALATLGLVLAVPAFAVDNFILKKEEGWFW